MNEFVKPHIDYVSIIDALLTISRDRITRWGGQMNRKVDAWQVQDVRTIGFMVGRQCGATDGALRWMANHPHECILITKDQYLRDAHAQTYQRINKRDASEYLSLVPCTVGSIEVWERKYLTDAIKERTRYIIVDDATFTVGMSYLKRPEFNKWVAETFHPDTFVILVK